MARYTIDEQVALLMQGTEYGDENLTKAMARELRERLILAEKENRPLRVYCGFDPRTSDLHIGHTVPMRKMRQFQELGHDVTFVVGRFTSLIGDPSDKDKVRAQLTSDQAAKNAETYANQAFNILDKDRTEIAYNDTWLSKLSFKDLIELSANFTLQQFLTRENFRKRWDQNDAVYLHEFFYAIMQGYDAYHLRADVQIGGTDQLFNIITASRKLMESLGEKPNIGIILGILPGTDGVVKMSKSLGNHIALNTTPEDMYGKVMSIPDSAMPSFFRLVTRWSPAEIDQIEDEIVSGKKHPRDVKMALAREIVAIYHGEHTVETAEQQFQQIFQQREDPSVMDRVTVSPGSSLLDIIVDNGLAPSKSEARRLMKQNGVRLDDEAITDPTYALELESTVVLRVGKRRFLRLEP
ncbi:MAG: tyrosine--tRNA ligase [Anaerolineales bacterium]|nr:tyrosine--tRNA ligase [Anaerolineales bacterium]